MYSYTVNIYHSASSLLLDYKRAKKCYLGESVLGEMLYRRKGTRRKCTRRNVTRRNVTEPWIVGAEFSRRPLNQVSGQRILITHLQLDARNTCMVKTKGGGVQGKKSIVTSKDLLANFWNRSIAVKAPVQLFGVQSKEEFP